MNGTRQRHYIHDPTDEIPLGLARLQTLVWAGGEWVGVNLYTAVTLIDPLRDALDAASLANGAPNLPDEAEVDEVKTFCIKVKPYYGESLSSAARKRRCTEYARNIVDVLEGRQKHVIVRGESLFFPVRGAAASKRKAA